jgi:hypothetical protein
MAWHDLLAIALAGINQILSAGIVIIATSLLLYNLTRNLNNRVARASGAVLANVTFAYLVDVFLSLGPNSVAAIQAARLQWLGLAFIPSSLFHLSDALLATTGLPSRGRRRIIVRILYAISTAFFIGAALTNSLATPILTGNGIKMQAQLVSLFPVYVAFFLTACFVTFININRARQRGLTAGSKRRMAYLQATILTPAIGIFPYSVMLPVSDDLSLGVQLFVNIANIIVILMLIFLSYPLSFFGSDVPDRVVKVELLRFLLRGPGTALAALGVIITTNRASAILSLPGDVFMPFAVVAVVLFWQWMIHLILPYLEKWLVYGDEDDEQIAKLQNLSDKMLTRGDLQQLIAATSEALCDYLRTEVAFIVSLTNGHAELVQATDDFDILDEKLAQETETIREIVTHADRVTGRSAFQAWTKYQIVPLYSSRATTDDKSAVLIGVLGIQNAINPINLLDEQDADLLYAYVHRVERTLDDLILQNEIFAALEGLMPQLTMTRSRANEVEYRAEYEKPQANYSLTRDEIYEQVRAALRHYWGGPGISRSRLLDLWIVQQALSQVDSPVQALRNILQEALERLRPESTRTLTASEWTFYNILDMRFIEGKKVRDVARRMSLSEPDLYRKQRLAIEALADVLIEMEREQVNP